MTDLPILHVEDDERDAFLLKRAFDDSGISNPLQVAVDGQEAIDYLSGSGRFADRYRFPLSCLIIFGLENAKGERLRSSAMATTSKKHSANTRNSFFLLYDGA